MGEESLGSKEITAPKLIIFIALLFMLTEAVSFMSAGGMGILYGIIELILIFVIFVSLELVSLGPVKIPYYWWIILIIGIILIVFSYLAPGNYLTAIMLLLAVIVELVTDKKDIIASKIILLFGIAFSLWDCVSIFIGYAPGAEIALVNAIFGLILVIILLILLLDLVDIKIPFTWWIVLTIAFVIFTWVSPFASGYPVVGFGGTILMIGWLLIILAL
jgi:hypothetical protein